MKNKIPWWLSGIIMGLLIVFTISVLGANRPFGASTYVPLLASEIFNLDPEKYIYINKIQDAGAWEGVMLVGALIGAFLTSVFITKTFKISFIPYAWKKYKNDSILSRMLWSFFAGFIMIIGARMAGGCTSGHMLSGISQTAFSSMIFGSFVIIALLLTGKLFYKKDS